MDNEMFAEKLGEVYHQLIEIENYAFDVYGTKPDSPGAKLSEVDLCLIRVIDKLKELPLNKGEIFEGLYKTYIKGLDVEFNLLKIDGYEYLKDSVATKLIAINNTIYQILADLKQVQYEH